MNTQLNRFKRFNRINSYKSKRGDKGMNVGRFKISKNFSIVQTNSE